MAADTHVRKIIKEMTELWYPMEKAKRCPWKVTYTLLIVKIILFYSGSWGSLPACCKVPVPWVPAWSSDCHWPKSSSSLWLLLCDKEMLLFPWACDLHWPSRSEGQGSGSVVSDYRPLCRLSTGPELKQRGQCVQKSYREMGPEPGLQAKRLWDILKNSWWPSLIPLPSRNRFSVVI